MTSLRQLSAHSLQIRTLCRSKQLFILISPRHGRDTQRRLEAEAELGWGSEDVCSQRRGSLSLYQYQQGFPPCSALKEGSRDGRSSAVIYRQSNMIHIIETHKLNLYPSSANLTRLSLMYMKGVMLVIIAEVPTVNALSRKWLVCRIYKL